MTQANFLVDGFRSVVAKYRGWMDRDDEIRELRSRCDYLKSQLEARDAAVQKYCLDNESMLSQLTRIRRIVADLERPEQP